jgi:hypothetical protein
VAHLEHDGEHFMRSAHVRHVFDLKSKTWLSKSDRRGGGSSAAWARPTALRYVNGI